MTTVLVLGANGQLGQELLAQPVLSDLKLFGRTRADTDITHANAVETALREVIPDIVVNAAAYTQVDKAEAEKKQAYRVNKDGALTLASVCADLDLPLIHISTDYVFDGSKQGPYLEDDFPAPLGVYGASKLAGEQAIRARHKKHVILRTSWLYGRYGSNFLKTMLRLAAERSELRVVGDQRGSPTCTADLAKAILELARGLRSKNSLAWGTYHFTGEGETSWCHFAEEILEHRQKVLGSRPKLTPITTADYPTAARRPMNSVLDNSKFKTTFRLTGKPWRQSVKESVDALLARNPA